MVSGGFTNASVPDHPRAFGFTILFYHNHSGRIFLFWVFYLNTAGIVEEIGWTGYAMPALLKTKMLCRRESSWLLWGLWHLPVIVFSVQLHHMVLI